MCLLLSVCLACLACIAGHKYSEAMNKAGPPPKPSVNLDEAPFRMHKLNALWEKAQKRLSEAKLKGLYSELKVQDKDELAWKKLRGAGQDKEGLKEAELRHRLKEIVERFGLAEHFKHHDAVPLEHPNAPRADRLFKDKKLNKLWRKVEQSGLDELELKALKEEFQHHQDKIDEYYEILDGTVDSSGKSRNDHENSLDEVLSATEDASDAAKRLVENGLPHVALKQHHQQLREGYEKLSARASQLAGMKDFEEEKVQQLWKMAQQADFTPTELNSLREELSHYEHRLRKLHHFRSELQLKADLTGGKLDTDPDEVKTLRQRVKQYNHKVGKLHGELEGRILQRRTEL